MITVLSINFSATPFAISSMSARPRNSLTPDRIQRHDLVDHRARSRDRLVRHRHRHALRGRRVVPLAAAGLGAVCSQALPNPALRQRTPPCYARASPHPPRHRWRWPWTRAETTASCISSTGTAGPAPSAAAPASTGAATAPPRTSRSLATCWSGRRWSRARSRAIWRAPTYRWSSGCSRRSIPVRRPVATRGGGSRRRCSSRATSPIHGLTSGSTTTTNRSRSCAGCTRSRRSASSCSATRCRPPAVRRPLGGRRGSIAVVRRRPSQLVATEAGRAVIRPDRLEWRECLGASGDGPAAARPIGAGAIQAREIRGRPSIDQAGALLRGHSGHRVHQPDGVGMARTA